MSVKIVIWFLLCFVLKAVRTEKNFSDVTLVVRKTYNQESINCVTKNPEYGLALLHNINNYKYSTQYFSNIIQCNSTNNYFKCLNSSDDYWKNNNWKPERSFYSNLNFLVDERWEGFTTKDTHIYHMTVAEFETIRDQYIFYLSIRTREMARIFLCNNDVFPSDSKCYWVELMSNYEGQHSAIGKCKEREISLNSQVPSKMNCSTSRNFTTLSSDLTEHRWTHFKIHYNKKQITVTALANDFSLTFFDENDEIKPSKLVIDSNSKPALWKVHDYEFYKSETPGIDKIGFLIHIHENCLSFFIAMCLKCRAKIVINSIDEEIFSECIHPVAELTWKLKKIILKVKNKFITVRFEKICDNCDNPFWAIDKIRSCSTNEIRVLSTTGKASEVSCQVIGDSLSNLKLTTPVQNRNDWNCSSMSVGSNCFECQDLFRIPDCSRGTTVCEYVSETESVCYSGFTGNKNNEECGLDCKQTCGVCFNGACDSNNGNCLNSKCLENFLPPMGQKIKCPILSVPAEVLNADFTYMQLKIADYQNNACHKPIYYKVQYKTDNGDCKETNVEKFSANASYTLKNLEPDTAYQIKIILITADNSSYAGNQVPSVNKSTTCEFINKSNIVVNYTNTTVEITYMDSKNSCTISNYFVNISCQDCFVPFKTINTQLKQYISYKDLRPYTNYFVLIRHLKIENNFYKYYFKTHEGVPNKIEDLIIYSKTNTSASLKILPPYPPTGKLQEYRIRLCSNTYCQHPYVPIMKCKLWDGYHCLDINNLESNQEYSVQVSAINQIEKTENSSKPVNLFTEESSSNPPYDINIKWDEYYNMTVTWKHPDVTNGPLTKFDVNISVNSQYCEMKFLNVNENNYTLVYTKSIPLNNESCHSKQLTICVCPFNTKIGNCATVKVESPPATPKFDTNPSAKLTNTTITLRVPSIRNFFNESFLYIIVMDEYRHSAGLIDNILNNKKFNLSSDLITFLVFNETNQTKTVVIGENNDKSNITDNGILKPDTTYLIKFLLFTKHQNFTRHTIYNIQVTTTTTVTINPDYLYVTLLLLLIIPVIIWIILRKCKVYFGVPSLIRTQRRSNFANNPDVIPLTEDTHTIKKVNLKPKLAVPITFEDTKHNQFSKPIKISDFCDYVKQSIENGDLEKQHQLLPRGPLESIKYGSLPENKTKNRYKTLISYDHSRVILEKVGNDPYSDYINANYIDGYKIKNAYIATQGPKASTIDDFWRMVWQENTKFIVMLTNINEGDNKQVEKYWPNIKCSETYGNIKVEFVSTKIYTDYEHRLFLISKGNVNRQIEQFHFISWPDHGVPLYSETLVPLLKELLNISKEDFPIVIHCSAGVGRTGTIILCDICLRMAAEEDTVDVFKYQYLIRKQRINMVDNIQQYKLVHMALLDLLNNPDTSIPSDEKMEKTILKLINSDAVEKQFKFINEVAWQDEVMGQVQAFKQHETSLAKNRFQDILPDESSRICLSRYSIQDEYSDYINAIEINGLKCPKKFIATQQPLSNTVCDFWRMIDEKAVKIIVSLNRINEYDDSYCVFWPTDKIEEIQPLPFILLKFLNETKQEDFDIISIMLYNTKNKEETKRTIKLLILKNWFSDQVIPESTTSMINLLETTEKLSNGEAPIVITCFDGATGCGLLIGLSFVIGKMKLEQKCDVCLAIRTIRRNRRHFIQKIEQLIFIYKAAINYLNAVNQDLML